MKFLIFTKQVPESEIHFDHAAKTLIRAGVKNTINPYDRRAISEAIRYRNEYGGEVIVATMGPPQAREVLLESILMGADRLIHIEDKQLAASDTLATSRLLAAAARKIGFDLLLCGQHSTDSETGQVPPELAELLEIPCAVGVRKIEYLDQRIRVECETDEGTSTFELALPAVISCAERLVKPIKTKNADLSQVDGDKIETIRLSDLQLSPQMVGLEGSPTWVADIYEQRIERHPERVENVDLAEAAQRITNAIYDVPKTVDIAPLPSKRTAGDRTFWCWVERYMGSIRPVSLEILNTAAALASKHGGVVAAIHVGAELRSDEEELLHSNGADTIYYSIRDFPHPDSLIALMREKISKLKPYAVLFPATSRGRLIAPRIAAQLELGLTGDCVGLEIDRENRLVQLKPAFGGTIIAPILSKTYPQMATIRPGALPPYVARTVQPDAKMVEWKLPAVDQDRLSVIREEIDAGAEAAQLDESDLVVCVGMGLGQENLPLAFQLAKQLNGAVGATRRVVDAGWLPRQYQVGLTGKFITPRIYLGLGVSGRYNHTIGIQKAGTVIAVNTDPNAEIFKACDLAVVGDCVAIAKELLAQ